MSDTRLVGVAKTVREDQIRDLSNGEQDQFIREVGLALEAELRVYVKDAQPAGDLVYQVQGPNIDPLQGKIWVHVMAGWFDLEKMDTTAGAYLTHVTRTNDTEPAVDIRVPHT